MRGFNTDCVNEQKPNGFCSPSAFKEVFNNNSQIALTTCVLMVYDVHVMMLMQCKQEEDRPSCQIEKRGGGGWKDQLGFHDDFFFSRGSEMHNEGRSFLFFSDVLDNCAFFMEF